MILCKSPLSLLCSHLTPNPHTQTCTPTGTGLSPEHEADLNTSPTYPKVIWSQQMPPSSTGRKMGFKFFTFLFCSHLETRF